MPDLRVPSPRPSPPLAGRRPDPPLEAAGPTEASGAAPSTQRATTAGRPFGAILADAAARIDGHERAVDAALERARRGAGLSPAELLAVQAGVYRYAHELELATKLVDKAAGAVRQTLESQR